jgi:spermidine synthase
MAALTLSFFFISGLCGLLYEVVWIRVAGTVIGNTTYAIGTVVAIFMGGLALGGWRGGRAADRREGGALLRLYGFLELGIALSAFAVPALLAGSEPLFRLLWNSVGEITVLYALLRILLVGLVLLVPTTLMGATLPVLGRFLSATGEAAARQAGLAYSINTLGGVAGSILSGFWLIPSLGLRSTTLVAVGLNLLIGLAALLTARGQAGETRPTLPPGPPPRPLALVASGLSGFAALIYEVAWTRSLVISMGSTVYAFTLILTTFILGLAIGSAAAAPLASRLRTPGAWLAGVQGALGIAALAVFPYLGDLPIRMAGVVEAHRNDFGALLRSEALLIAIVVLLPTILLGASFPLTVRMATDARENVGRAVGAVYTWNTLGSIAGSVAASFLLIPAVGLGAAIRLGATVNLLLAAALVRGAAPRLPALAGVPLLAAGIAWILPGWDPGVVASGAYLYADRARELRLDLRKYIATESTILAQYWDAYGLTTVHSSGKTGLSIRVNGKADASTSTDDMPTQRLVGHLGLLHAPRIRRALVIGLGSGVTLGAVADHPAEHIDCVEISSAGLRAASHFSGANEHVLDNPRVHVVVGDGRNAVQFAREPYDVIVSQPSNLWISGMANLFTRDFFETAARRLTPEGVFCQWVQAYRLPKEDFQLILRTFFSVFPEGSLWEVFPGQDYILLGSLRPLAVSAGDLERRMAVPAVAADFRSPRIPPQALLLGRFIAEASSVRAAAGPEPVITDDRCSIEYSTSRAMFTRLQPETLLWLEDLRRHPLPEDRYPGCDAARVAEARERQRAIASVIAFESEHHPAHEVLERFKERVGLLGDDPHVRDYFDSIANTARIDAQTLRLSGRYPLAQRVLRSIPRDSKHYPDALFEQGDVAQRLGDRSEQLRCVRELKNDYPESFAGRSFLALQAEEEGRTEAALGRWREALAARPDSDYAHAHLASLLGRLGRRDEALEEARKALEIEPSNALARQVQDDLGRSRPGAPR